jgi:hypothetical protein
MGLPPISNSPGPLRKNVPSSSAGMTPSMDAGSAQYSNSVGWLRYALCKQAPLSAVWHSTLYTHSQHGSGPSTSPPQVELRAPFSLSLSPLTDPYPGYGTATHLEVLHQRGRHHRQVELRAPFSLSLSPLTDSTHRPLPRLRYRDAP